MRAAETTLSLSVGLDLSLPNISRNGNSEYFQIQNVNVKRMRANCSIFRLTSTNR